MARFVTFVCIGLAAGLAAPASAQVMCSPNALFNVGNKMGLALADIYRAPSDNARSSFLREAQSKLMSLKTNLRRAGITTQDKAVDGAIKAVVAFAGKVGPTNLITIESAGKLGKDVEKLLGPVRSEVGRACRN